MEQFKTKPYDHQLESLNRSRGREYFADFSEMGTGKSWVRINEAAVLFAEGVIDGWLIMAPNGVHQNWVLTQLPLHAPDWLQWKAVAWGAKDTKAFTHYLNSIYDPAPQRTLRILTANWDALQTARGLAFIKMFCETFSGKLNITCDESQRIKNPSAIRTKMLNKKLRPHANVRRIMTGTPILNSPFDAFSQMMFLDEDILRTTSFFAFKTEYAELLQPGNRLLDHIAKQRVKLDAGSKSALADAIKTLGTLPDADTEALVTSIGQMDFEAAAAHSQELRERLRDWPQRNYEGVMSALANIERVTLNYLARVQRVASNVHRLPQIVMKGKEGKPKYKNLDKLEALLAPHSFRVLKSECLDLPEKIYTQSWFEMTPAQKEIYDKMEDEARLVLENSHELPVSKLTALMKLSQICSGFVLEPVTGNTLEIPGLNPKLMLLEDRLEDLIDGGNKVIVWARFRAELKKIEELCAARGWTHCRYDGETSREDRGKFVAAFENGEIDVFIGQPQSGGTGITLVAAGAVIYFSNSFSLEDRLQSEDRAHRIGQSKSVVYEDLLCNGTIDVAIVKALRNKQDIAALITGDQHKILGILRADPF